LLSGIFRVDTKSPQSLNDVYSLLDFRAEEALAPLFQPDTSTGHGCFRWVLWNLSAQGRFRAGKET